MLKTILRKFSKGPLRVGMRAPDFSLVSHLGPVVRLSEFLGKKWVVLYFYPKDNTKYCIIESMAFRDQIQEFEKIGAEILGVSSDGVESHQAFAKEYSLPFHLLSDVDNSVRRLFGVTATFGMIPGRVTFVIDPDGIIRHVFSAQFDPHSHVAQSLEIIRRSSLSV